MAEGESLIIVEVVAAMVVSLVALYLAIYLIRRRRTGGLGKNKCSICGHSVKFMSDCCHVPVKKFAGRNAQCPKCKLTCEVVCPGCGHEKCEKYCEKCVRYI